MNVALCLLMTWQGVDVVSFFTEMVQSEAVKVSTSPHIPAHCPLHQQTHGHHDAPLFE